MLPSRPWLLVAVLLSVGCVGIARAGAGAAAALPSPQSLPHTNLLLYHDDQGTVRVVKSRAQWEQRRAEILRAAQTIMGPLPGAEKRCPLAVTIESEIDCGTYLCRKLTYGSEPGSRVPAYLLVPKTALGRTGECPAVLALHPTDSEYGHRVVIEPMRPHYPPYARDLAERGFVVLAPAYPLLANYQPDLHALGYRSGTMKAIWDNVRGLDLLESLPFVRRGKLGAIGHSLGGHNAIFTALFDARIHAVVSSCGFDAFRDYMNGDLRGWTSDRYMPGLLPYRDHLADLPFDFDELVGALAPRPLFVNAPLSDANFQWRSVDAVMNAVRPIYGLYESATNFVVEHPACGHEFPAKLRESAYRWLAGKLQR